MYDPEILNNHARLARVVVEDNGCWGLTRHRRHTYASLTWDGVSDKAHRVSFKLYKGEIPTDKVVGHECNNKWCVNPAHLEAVTQLENLAHDPNWNGHKTECKRGHPFTPENTYWQPNQNKRACKTCRQAHQRRYNAEQKMRFKRAIPR